MKGKLITIAVIATLAIFGLTILYGAEDNPNKHKNGFQRKFIANAITRIKVAPFENAVYQLCGTNGGLLYLSGQIPGLVYVADRQLSRIYTVQLPLPKIPNLAPVFYTVVCFPDIFILGGNIKIIISGNLLTKKYTIHNLNTGPFGNVSVAGNNNFILRDIDTLTYNALFKKVNRRGEVQQAEKGISERLHDFGFLDYGKLTYDSTTHLFVYVSRYSNRITCFDSSLTVQYISRTIDTSSHPKINIAKEQGSVTIKTPPFTVNQDACSSQGQLFVHSGLKADDENTSDFNDRAVFDVYTEITGAYIGSFYIPNYDGESFKNFNILGKNRLIVFYDQHIVSYDLTSTN
jgi:hypothetical protein